MAKRSPKTAETAVAEATPDSKRKRRSGTLEQVQYFLTERADLADRIQEHWVGRDVSYIGLQYLEYRDGRVYLRPNIMERTDVIHVWADEMSIHISPNGSVHIDSDPRKLTEAQLEYGKAVGKLIAEREQEHLDYQRRWLELQPWKHVDGMTPRGAVRTIRRIEKYELT